MANVVTNPTADQSITSFDLLAASGNLMQSLGNAAAPWNAILRDETVSNLNNVRIVDGTRYTNIQAAITDLPATGGIVVCRPGYRETITSTIILGSTSSTVLLVMQQDAILSCGITGGSTPMFNVHDGSGIVGSGLANLSSRAGASVISMNGGASITNVIQTADNPQGSIVLQGFIIDNANLATISNAFIELVNLNDYCIIRDVKGAYFPNKGLHVSATTGGVKTVGPIIIENCFFDGVNLTDAQPLFIESDGSGATNGVHVLGGYWVNPGGSKACIELNGNGGTTGTLRDILISEVYTQSGTNSSITGIKITDAAGVIVMGSEFQVTNSASGMTGISINNSGSNNTHSITVHNFRLSAGSSNTGLNNTITSETLLGSTGNIPLYIYQGTGGTQVPSNLTIGGDSKLALANKLTGTFSVGTSSPSATAHVTANATTGVLPATITGAAIIGDANITLGSGSGKAYGVVGVAKGSSDSSGDKAYGGYFVSSASNNTSTEVGIHAETTGGGAGATVAEFLAGGSSVAHIDGAGNIVAAGNISCGNTTGFGNGTAGTSLTTTLKGTGQGPTNPQKVINYFEINIGGTNFWVPLMQ